MWIDRHGCDGGCCRAGFSLGQLDQKDGRANRTVCRETSPPATLAAECQASGGGRAAGTDAHKVGAEPATSVPVPAFGPLARRGYARSIWDIFGR